MSVNVSFGVEGMLVCLKLDGILHVNNFFFATTLLVVLPLSLRVLHLGLQRAIFTATTLSYSDCFVLNLAAMELIGVAAYALGIYGINTSAYQLTRAGFIIQFFPWYGQIVVSVLTCVDRYLAVVHPVAYLRFKRQQSVRYVTIAFPWLWCSLGMYLSLLAFTKPLLAACIGFSQVIFFLGVISFCSLSAVNALKRPRPGQAVRTVVDKTKRTAVRIILIITGVLVFKYTGYVLFSGSSMVVHSSAVCRIFVVVKAFDFPSSCLLPLLFLHKAGKLNACKHLRRLCKL
nr:nociceptin receptor-like [Nerophis lumbriciformis]